MDGAVGKQCGVEASYLEMTQDDGWRGEMRDKGRGKRKVKGFKRDGQGGIRERGKGRGREEEKRR